MATKDPNDVERALESTIATADHLIDGGGLERIYGDNPDQLVKRVSHWESLRIRAQEQLYNIRHGDVPCRPTESEL